jgi:glycosyltransferase involved in cell wall biosynthesis
MTEKRKLRVLLMTLEPPELHTGVRIILHRHLVQDPPFDLKVIVNRGAATETATVDLLLEFPPWLDRLRRTRLNPWVKDFENLVWPYLPNRAVWKVAEEFRPDVVLTIADHNLSYLAERVARRLKVPLAVMFLDWFPVMKGRFGHRWTQGLMSRRFRNLYKRCDLAFCTSDGMQQVLGPHANSHVIYPIGGKHKVTERRRDGSEGKFRLVYVGSVENFYGRMHCALIEQLKQHQDLELRIGGPQADWPREILEDAKRRGIYLGFVPPERAAQELADADALLVVMSFEKEHELFMRTSFTTKFLDYAAFGKPIILWGPDYCTPSMLARREDRALVVSDPSPSKVVDALVAFRSIPELLEKYSAAAQRLHSTVFSPERLQSVFTEQIEKLVER